MSEVPRQWSPASFAIGREEVCSSTSHVIVSIYPSFQPRCIFPGSKFSQLTYTTSIDISRSPCFIPYPGLPSLSLFILFALGFAFVQVALSPLPQAWKIDNAIGPPQYSFAFPLHFMRQFP